jgi:hypothetical protein
VYCDNTTAHDDFYGYQIDIFVAIATELGWSKEDYVYSCLDWTAMMMDLSSGEQLLEALPV